jgi:hypothetical protein
VYRHAPLPAAQQVSAVLASRQVAVDATENDLREDFSPPMVAADYASQIPDAPLPQSVSLETAVVANEALPADFAARPSPSPLRFLHLWSRSFLADVHSSWRQFRRAIRSFETHRWNPLIRDLRRQLHQVRVHASRLPSHPEWQKFRSHAISASQNGWASFTSAVPPWLAQRVGIKLRATRKHAQAVATSRDKHRRGILSLRRWLHEPLTTQQKRTHGNQGRSVG